MRARSLTAVGSTAGALAKDIASQVRALRPDALLWLTDSAKPEEVASALSDTCGASVGGVSMQGLLGGGGEHGSSSESSRVVALALSASEGSGATAFHSPPEGLPDLPAESWAAYAAATPDASPHLMLLASPPRTGAFELERWLGRLDRSLPWAKKVGGLTAGDERLFVNGVQHDGGAVGLALEGVAMEAASMQGALPIGPSFAITESEGNFIRALDGKEVGEALEPVLDAFRKAPTGNLMAGVSVPTRAPAAGAAAAAPPLSSSPYVVRALMGYNKDHSFLAIGASPDLLEATGRAAPTPRLLRGERAAGAASQRRRPRGARAPLRRPDGAVPRPRRRTVRRARCRDQRADACARPARADRLPRGRRDRTRGQPHVRPHLHDDHRAAPGGGVVESS